MEYVIVAFPYGRDVFVDDGDDSVAATKEIYWVICRAGSMRSARSGGSGWPTDSIRWPRNGLRTLRNRWQRAPTGEGPVVMIIGEPESATHAKGTKPEIWKLAAQGALQSHAAPTRQRDRPRGI